MTPMELRSQPAKTRARQRKIKSHTQTGPISTHQGLSPMTFALRVCWAPGGSWEDSSNTHTNTHRNTHAQERLKDARAFMLLPQCDFFPIVWCCLSECECYSGSWRFTKGGQEKSNPGHRVILHLFTSYFHVLMFTVSVQSGRCESHSPTCSDGKKRATVWAVFYIYISYRKGSGLYLRLLLWAICDIQEQYITKHLVFFHLLRGQRHIKTN